MKIPKLDQEVMLKAVTQLEEVLKQVQKNQKTLEEHLITVQENQVELYERVDRFLKKNE